MELVNGSMQERCGRSSGFANFTVVVDSTLPVPGVPTDLSGPGGTDDDGVYDITWSAATGTVTSYTLQWRLTGGSWSTVQNTDTLSYSESGRTDGTWEYQVRACNDSGCSNYATAIDVIVSVSVSSPNTPPAPIVATAPSVDTQSDGVGVTAGSFRVDESGAATYSIPILTAPGIAGVVPQVSLNYSSQAGPGIAGMGWSIGGLSAITRCRQTLETDDNSDGIHLSARDRYCLDGQRLVRIPDGSETLTNLGTYDIEYRTEIDQFARIVGYGAGTGNPTHFVVWRKDGSVSEYGNTTDARFEATGTASGFTWAQNEFADSVGNTISFEYLEDTVDGSQLIDRIEYAGGDAEILFTYETLPSNVNPKSFYIAGGKFSSDQRLTSIESRNDGVELRTYRPTYNATTGTHRSRMTQIEECNGTTCYEPTVFEWAATSVGVDFNGLSYAPGGVGGMKLADLNGDGVNEVLFLAIDEQSSDVDYYVRPMRFDQVSGKYVPGDFGLSSNNAAPAGIYIDEDHPSAWNVVDYNNDGRHDLIYLVGGQLVVRLGQDYNGQGDIGGTAYPVGSGFATGTFTVADYDGDGLADILNSGPNGVRLLKKDPNGTATLPYHYETAVQMTGLPGCYAAFFGTNQCIAGHYAISPQSASPLLADFNADGVVDLFREELYIDVFSEEAGLPPQPNLTVWTLYASSSGTSDYQVYAAFVDLSWNRTTDDFEFGDFNGDGLTDIAYRSGDYVNGQAAWSYRLNNGDGFETPATLGTYGLAEARQLRFMDYNGDGAADLFYLGTGSTIWAVREWNGAGFASGTSTGVLAKPSTGADIDEWTTAFFDANGDGKLDAINAKVRDRSDREIRTYIGRDAFQPNDVIDKITNGFGMETDIVYTAISDPAHSTLYTKGTDANTLDWGAGSPVFDLKHPMYVVRQAQSSAPTAGSTPGNVDFGAKSSISYRYGEFKIQSGGRGSLGFGFVVSVDDQTGFETTTHYRQDFPYIGRPKSTEVVTGDGDRISYASNTWADFNSNGSNRQPYLSVAEEQVHSTDTTNQATGAFSVGGVISTATTTTTMDSQYGQYGDVLSVVIETVAQTYSYKKTTTNTYHTPDLEDWHTGRLNRTTVEHDRTDNAQASETRTSRFNYDATSGLLTQEIVEPDQTGALTLTTTYVHDSQGNVVRTTQNGYRGFQLPASWPEQCG